MPAIAAALNFSFHEQDEPESQLLRYLKQKRLLLILDNAEGILDAGLVLKLLGNAPHLKLLVTTREALNVREEWFHPIAGMHLGGNGQRRRCHHIFQPMCHPRASELPTGKLNMNMCGRSARWSAACRWPSNWPRPGSKG